MITKWRTAILELLKVCICLKESQLIAWAALRIGMTEHQAKGVLHRLRLMGAVIWKGGLVGLPHREPNPDTMTAFDILLQIAGKDAENMTRGRFPFALRFTAGAGDDLKVFSVAVVHTGAESEFNAAIANERLKGQRLIIVLDDIAQREKIAALSDCYYAMPDMDAPTGGRFRFFID
ncbi:DUF5697 family protein [Oscillospiraceae bacterium OttesenSCG-928-F05]|nr:DUF5697 family protein [Oscillospiraceae bacterium OttesenSCG-928-F05]